MQGTRVRALVREDPTCHRATKPMCHNYWACALEPASHNYWAHVPQLLKPMHREPVLHNKRSHCNEKPTHRSEEWPPLAATRESPCAAMKTQRSQNKINICCKSLKKIIVQFSVFWGTSILFSIVATPIYIPTNSAQISLFSTSSPALLISCLFDDGHPDRCEVISHCGFDLYFPDG